ncbi:hypothetical protein [Nocardia brasiliensis]|uniref:Uncharacterized protein n=1 Tax=Nocardia brasiliensis (strain ATCC 700358 / HUJEG-1) TaxID=1133849 RepID=K0EJW6_NOCB7|nr:hypothetical protein [Nocardia brasiliensis]AFT99692.1 hypothetical protein O3I_008650 [Nocardia brasiliensis ATCC 700358]
MLNSHRHPADDAERAGAVPDQVNPVPDQVNPTVVPLPQGEPQPARSEDQHTCGHAPPFAQLPAPMVVEQPTTFRALARRAKVDLRLVAGSVFTAATCTQLAAHGWPDDGLGTTMAGSAALFAARTAWPIARAVWRYCGPEEISFRIRFRGPRS